MEPIETPRTVDATADRNPEVQRVTLQIAGQLAQRGVEAHDDDTPSDHADILSAVERFEAAVRERGGDSFTNSLQSSDPERSDFVLPRRGADEGASAYIGRLRGATERLGTSPG